MRSPKVTSSRKIAVSEPPQIGVHIEWLSENPGRPGTIARVTVVIAGKDGRGGEWKNVRLVFDGYWPVDFPIGSFSVYVDGQSRGCYTKGKPLFPPIWRKAARDAVYDAVEVAVDARKKQRDADIAAGTRWAPLPLTDLYPKDIYALEPPTFSLAYREVNA